MSEDPTDQKGGLASLAKPISLLNAKCLDATHDGKHLVEFLIARKKLQIVAHKNASGSLKQSLSGQACVG